MTHIKPQFLHKQHPSKCLCNICGKVSLNNKHTTRALSMEKLVILSSYREVLNMLYDTGVGNTTPSGMAVTSKQIRTITRRFQDLVLRWRADNHYPLN